MPQTNSPGYPFPVPDGSPALRLFPSPAPPPFFEPLPFPSPAPKPFPAPRFPPLPGPGEKGPSVPLGMPTCAFGGGAGVGGPTMLSGNVSEDVGMVGGFGATIGKIGALGGMSPF